MVVNENIVIVKAVQKERFAPFEPCGENRRRDRSCGPALDFIDAAGVHCTLQWVNGPLEEKAHVALFQLQRLY